MPEPVTVADCGVYSLFIDIIVKNICPFSGLKLSIVALIIPLFSTSTISSVKIKTSLLVQLMGESTAPDKAELVKLTELPGPNVGSKPAKSCSIPPTVTVPLLVDVLSSSIGAFLGGLFMIVALASSIPKLSPSASEFAIDNCNSSAIASVSVVCLV